MSDWIQTFDAVFFLTIATLTFGCMGLVVRYCLKSKCDTVNLCCGFITIHRDVKLEEEIEIKEMEYGVKDEKEETKD